MRLVFGYVGFLAFFYRIFGDHQWVPLVAQAVLNASIPYMLYKLVRIDYGERVAIVSAVLIGVLSFNTVYTSTQASDAVCTVLFLAAVLAFTNARRSGRLATFALSGLLAGLAFQFRPNLILFPPFMGAAFLIWRPFAVAKIRQAAVFILVFVLSAVPWVIRNYAWSGLFIPASTHGGKQLWFGTLQVGDYRESWLYNPRAAFEESFLNYTSVDEEPLVLTGGMNLCGSATLRSVDIVYWTNRDAKRVRVHGEPDSSGQLTVTLPRFDAPTAISYYADIDWTREGTEHRTTTPEGGANAPQLFVVSRDHLGDVDFTGQALDLFDLARMLRHIAWQEPLPNAGQLDFDSDGAVTDRDLASAFALLVHPDASAGSAVPVFDRVNRTADKAEARLTDGSTLTIARAWTGRVTAIELRGQMTRSIANRSRTFASLRDATPPAACVKVEGLAVNRVPYRSEPHDMRRFIAFSLDNVRATPLAYLAASAERAIRLFVITGSDDRATAVQYSRGWFVYAGGRIVSIVILLLCAAGLVIAWLQGYPLFTLIVPLLYVPLTICFMLINARYAMTVQPFVYAFIAVAAVWAWDRFTARAAGTGAATAARQ